MCPWRLKKSRGWGCFCFFFWVEAWFYSSLLLHFPFSKAFRFARGGGQQQRWKWGLQMIAKRSAPERPLRPLLWAAFRVPGDLNLLDRSSTSARSVFSEWQIPKIASFCLSISSIYLASSKYILYRLLYSMILCIHSKAHAFAVFIARLFKNLTKKSLKIFKL